jgi:hypothetical protein
MTVHNLAECNESCWMVLEDFFMLYQVSEVIWMSCTGFGNGKACSESPEIWAYYPYDQELSQVGHCPVLDPSESVDYKLSISIINWMF